MATLLTKALLFSKVDYALEFVNGLTGRKLTKIDALLPCGRLALGLLCMTAIKSVLNEGGIKPEKVRRQYLLIGHCIRLVRMEIFV